MWKWPKLTEGECGKAEASENEEPHVVKAIEKFDALLESESRQQPTIGTNYKNDEDL